MAQRRTMEQGGLRPGTVVLEKLRVVRLLGEGGLGAVYQVEHLLTGHHRALKLLRLGHQHNERVVQRFLREASAAGRIGNSHIVECLDAGRLPSGEPYLLMEWLQGQSLADILQGAGPLEPHVAAGLIRQACEALSAAHRVGIIHRDLKPDNLFVTDYPTRPFLKVLDFGISKFDRALTGRTAITQAGTAMGTPYYMPPEQWRGAGDVDARADVYSLGVVLYECVSGSVPYFAEALPALALVIDRGEAAPLHLRCPGLPAEFSAVVHRAFSKDPAARFPTADALSAALEPFAGPGADRRRATDVGSDNAPRASRAAPPPPQQPAKADDQAEPGSSPAPDQPRRRLAAASALSAVALLVVGWALWPAGGSQEPASATGEKPVPSSATAPRPGPARPPALDEALATFMSKHSGTIEICYMQELRQKPTLAGKITMRFTMTKTGRTRDVEVAEDTMRDPAVAACIKKVIEAWALPFEPEEDVPVTFPFNFSIGE